MSALRVLVACEYSGTVRRAFRALGHDAWSCDLLPSDDDSEFHFQGDVFDYVGDKIGFSHPNPWHWDLMIAHPPCTYLSNSGVTHLHTDETRSAKMKEAAWFFRRLYDSAIPKIAIENPIQHKYAKAAHGCGNQSQVIQPWMFGHTEQKATCLWLKGLQKLIETKNVKAEMLLLPANQRQRLHYLPPSADRWKLRSKTFDGIAAAMAMQWGGVVN